MKSNRLSRCQTGIPSWKMSLNNAAKFRSITNIMMSSITIKYLIFNRIIAKMGKNMIREPTPRTQRTWLRRLLIMSLLMWKHDFLTTDLDHLIALKSIFLLYDISTIESFVWLICEMSNDLAFGNNSFSISCFIY